MRVFFIGARAYFKGDVRRSIDARAGAVVDVKQHGHARCLHGAQAGTDWR
jgi:hypothetical protein